MSAWIGPLGSLIEFKCPSAVESSSEDPHVYFRPLGGDVNVTRLGDGTRPRVWDVSVSTARPNDVAALEALASGVWGPGPFAFIPPGAPSVNVLGKRAALARGTAPDDYAHSSWNSAISTPEGWAGAHYATTLPSPVERGFGDGPVLPGQPVTGRAFLQAMNGETASIRVLFYAVGHSQLGVSQSATTTSVTGEYVHVTTTAPEGAAYARLLCTAATVTNPQLTWTPEPRTWAQSKASSNVVVSPLSDSVRRATGRRGEEQITDHRFTVTELRA